MSELHQVRVDGKVIKIQQFGAREGWKLLRKLSEIAGPSVASIANDNFEQAVQNIFEKISEDEMFALLDQLTSVCLVDDAKFNDSHLRDYYFTLKLCGEVIKYNFEDFFSPIQKLVADLAMNVDE